MPSASPITNSGCGVRPPYSRATATGSPARVATAPAAPRELALLEVADRVRGEQPVALQELRRKNAVARLVDLEDGRSPELAGLRDRAISRATVGLLAGAVRQASLGTPLVRGAELTLVRDVDPAVLGEERGEQAKPA